MKRKIREYRLPIISVIRGREKLQIKRGPIFEKEWAVEVSHDKVWLQPQEALLLLLCFSLSPLAPPLHLLLYFAEIDPPLLLLELAREMAPRPVPPLKRNLKFSPHLLLLRSIGRVLQGVGRTHIAVSEKIMTTESLITVKIPSRLSLIGCYMFGE